MRQQHGLDNPSITENFTVLRNVPACEEEEGGWGVGGEGVQEEALYWSVAGQCSCQWDCIYGNASSRTMDRRLFLRRRYDFILTSHK